MTSTTVHQPRVAWDTAMVLTQAAGAESPVASWCRDWVAALLGPVAASTFLATRRRLVDPASAPSEAHLQAGLWRVRIEDVLRDRPELAVPLLDRVADTRSRLARR